MRAGTSIFRAQPFAGRPRDVVRTGRPRRRQRAARLSRVLHGIHPIRRARRNGRCAAHAGTFRRRRLFEGRRAQRACAPQICPRRFTSLRPSPVTSILRARGKLADRARTLRAAHESAQRARGAEFRAVAARCSDKEPQTIRSFWEPFMVPALNAPLERMNAAEAAFVISTAFLRDRGAARFGYSYRSAGADHGERRGAVGCRAPFVRGPGDGSRRRRAWSFARPKTNCALTPRCWPCRRVRSRTAG